MAFRKILALKGQRYGSLTVMKEVDSIKISGSKKRMLLCNCDCGKEVIIRLEYLRSGHTKSCGCRKRLSASKTHRKHGECRTLLYLVWRSMLSRCLNEKVKGFVNYGGRGISVCEEWKEYKNFSRWAKKSGYKKGLTIERINNNGNYNPENCKFADMRAQGNNKRNNRFFVFNGMSLTAPQWGRRTGIHPETIKSRVDAGWPIEKALTKKTGIGRDKV